MVEKSKIPCAWPQVHDYRIAPLQQCGAPGEYICWGFWYCKRHIDWARGSDPGQVIAVILCPEPVATEGEEMTEEEHVKWNEDYKAGIAKQEMLKKLWQVAYYLSNSMCAGEYEITLPGNAMFKLSREAGLTIAERVPCEDSPTGTAIRHAMVFAFDVVCKDLPWGDVTMRLKLNPNSYSDSPSIKEIRENTPVETIVLRHPQLPGEGEATCDYKWPNLPGLFCFLKAKHEGEHAERTHPGVRADGLTEEEAIKRVQKHVDRNTPQ